MNWRLYRITGDGEDITLVADDVLVPLLDTIAQRNLLDTFDDGDLAMVVPDAHMPDLDSWGWIKSVKVTVTPGTELASTWTERKELV